MANKKRDSSSSSPHSAFRNPHPDPIVIVGAARTPIGNFLGELKNASAVDLGATAIKAAVARAMIKPDQISEVIMGCVLPAGLGQAPARQAAINAGLPYSTGALTINKVCGSGLKAVMLAHDALQLETHYISVAGGMESMSNAPYLLMKARTGYRMGKQEMIDSMLHDGLEDAYEKGKSMGCFAEDCAKQYHFTREAQDQFALNSLQRAKKAIEEGLFKKEIAPVTIKTAKEEIVVDTDEGPLTAKPEKIPLLKPAFSKDGTVTAANSSSISDGAAALVLMKKSVAIKLQLKPLATIIAHATHAEAPDKFTIAPIGAIKNLLAKTHWSITDVDLFEINEAFAVVTMAAMQDLQIPHHKVNVHGGANALGHPIGASGARILVTLLYALLQKKLKRGIASLCLGGGEAVAVAIEVTNEFSGVINV